MKVDWSDIERKWQKKWEDEGIFDADPDPNKPKFFLTVPYPYVNAPVHIGHGRTYTVGDAIARYKRLRGYNVLWPMGFHLTGTPVLAVADRIKSGDEKIISLYRDYVSIYIKDEKKVDEIVNGFTKPKNVALFFADHISQDMKSIGLGIDWRRQFTTIDHIYNKFVEWQYHKLKEKGLLVKGSHPVLYSPNDESAVGEDDIKDGDINKVSVQEFTAIKFQFEDGYLVASTLRPETIFGVTNLWINPDATYVKARIDGEIWYVSKEAAEKLKYQKEHIDIVEKMPGSYFVDKKARILDMDVPILPASFVDPDNASGVVYSVPAHAPYDYMALYDLWKAGKYKDVEPVVIIDIPGYTVPAKDVCEKLGIKDQNDPRLEDATKEVYKLEYYKGKLNERCGQFAGMSIKEIKDQVKDWMRKEGMASVIYETSRKAVTRSGNKVIVAILRDQWFIDYSQEWWKKKTHEWIDKMFIYPEKYRQSFHDTVDWLRQRPCARKRGLGTRLPFDKDWIIESLSDSTIYMAFYTIVHKIKERGIEPDDAFFDYVFLGKGEPKPEWKDIREEFVYWYPNDLRHTAPAHISNHLTFFIMHHIAIFPENDWPRGISLNEMLIREGAKMSKSKGNVIPLAEISRKYTADLFRLYILSAADLDTTLDWKEKEVTSVRKKLDEFRSIIEECIDENPNKDTWLYNMFKYRLAKATEHFESLKFRDAIVELFFNVLNDIKKYKKNPDYKGAVSGIIDDWLISLSPIIPHTCEEYWNRHHTGFISLQNWPEAKVDKVFIQEEKLVSRVIDDIKSIISTSKQRYKKAYIYTAEDWKYTVLGRLANGEGIPDIIKDFDDKKRVVSFIKAATRDGLTREFMKLDEPRVIENNKSRLSAETGLEIVVNSDYDPAEKAKRALPMRPGIYLE